LKGKIMDLLNYVDRAAGAWLQMRNNRAVDKLTKEHPDLTQMDVIDAHMDKDGWAVEVAVHTDLVFLAETMAEMLTKNKAENYLQMVMFPRVSSGVRPVEITLRWYYGGLTPAEKNTRLEAQIEKQKAEITSLRELLREAVPGAAFASCFYAEAEIANACWHCCDWNGWVEKVCGVLGIALPSPDAAEEMP